MQRDIREAAVDTDGAADARESELGDVLLVEVEESEVAAVLGGDLGRAGHSAVDAGPDRGPAAAGFGGGVATAGDSGRKQ